MQEYETTMEGTKNDIQLTWYFIISEIILKINSQKLFWKLF
jgi:hypothetical protein